MAEISSLKELVTLIDYAYLNPYASLDSFSEFLKKAQAFPFRAICVPPSLIKFTQKWGYTGRIVGVLDFPFGYSTTLTKMVALEEMLTLGVKEIDLPLNFVYLKSKEILPLKRELETLRKIAEGKILKGIIECPLLTEEERLIAVNLLIDCGFDFVKTSTGYSGKSTTPEEVKHLSQLTQQRIKIKASGGIRSLKDVLAILAAGAHLIGTSNGYEILREYLSTQEGAISTNFSEVEVYVDGACLRNPGPGGYAALIKRPDKEEVLAGGEPHTTNNRMELMALITALSHLQDVKKITIYTDSEYLLKGATLWLPKWRASNFKTTQGGQIKNLDLWERIDKLLTGHQVTFKKVEAHSGHQENERVDKIAREWARRWEKTPF